MSQNNTMQRIPVSCPNCGRVLGNMTTGPSSQIAVIYIESVLEGWLIRQGKICCPSCGSWFHYSQPKRSWSDLWQAYLGVADVAGG